MKGLRKRYKSVQLREQIYLKIRAQADAYAKRTGEPYSMSDAINFLYERAEEVSQENERLKRENERLKPDFEQREREDAILQQINECRYAELVKIIDSSENRIIKIETPAEVQLEFGKEFLKLREELFDWKLSQNKQQTDTD